MRRLTNTRLPGRDAPVDVWISGDGPDLDAGGAVVAPSFVDVSCDPGFPGFPPREGVGTLCAAALAGGFSDLLTTPAVDPVVDTPEQLARIDRVGPGGVRLLPAAALTAGLRGEELAELGLLAGAGAAALSDGGRPMRDTAVLRNALEYARAFRVPIVLRPCDADLDRLGVMHDAPLAAVVGLRGNPSANEEIGVARVVALVRATGTPVHLTHIGSARGVALVRAAVADGLPVTASTPARNLLLDASVLDDNRYDTRFRLHPPLRGAADREALVAAVREGLLCLSADHQPRAPEEKELEFERAVPGSSGLESAFAAALTALGDLPTVLRALGAGPRAALGLTNVGLVLVDPEARHVVDTDAHRSRSRNDALRGARLRGVVRSCLPDAVLVSPP